MFTALELAAIKSTKMSDVIKRNTGVNVPTNVFLAASGSSDMNKLGVCFNE